MIKVSFFHFLENQHNNNNNNYNNKDYNKEQINVIHSDMCACVVAKSCLLVSVWWINGDERSVEATTTELRSKVLKNNILLMTPKSFPSLNLDTDSTHTTHHHHHYHHHPTNSSPLAMFKMAAPSSRLALIILALFLCFRSPQKTFFHYVNL